MNPSTQPPFSVYLRVRGGAQAIAFYTQAFGAEEIFRLIGPGELIGHAELRLAGSVLMLADEFPEWEALGPQSLGGVCVGLFLAVPDADAAAARAVAAGAELLGEVSDEFYGERVARLRDPFGYEWKLAQTIETLSVEEMQRRYDRMLSG